MSIFNMANYVKISSHSAGTGGDVELFCAVLKSLKVKYRGTEHVAGAQYTLKRAQNHFAEPKALGLLCTLSPGLG